MFIGILRIAIKYWLPVLIWVYLIFFFSSLPSLKTDLPTFLDFILRKIAHMTEYAILCFLIFRALRQGHSLVFNQSLILAILFSILYAFSDEYHQSFIVGRQGTLMDVMIDSFGIITAGLFINENIDLKKESD